MDLTIFKSIARLLIGAELPPIIYTCNSTKCRAPSGAPSLGYSRTMTESQEPIKRILPIVESTAVLVELKEYHPSGELCLSELLKRQQNLRPVSPSQLPLHLGGRHTSFRHEDSPLKKELLCRAAEIQGQLRPRYRDFQRTLRIRTAITKPFRDELVSLFDSHGPFTKESPMRPKYALDKLVRSRPGWHELQDEIRAYDPSQLRQVLFNDFYVIQSTTLPV